MKAYINKCPCDYITVEYRNIDSYGYFDIRDKNTSN